MNMKITSINKKVFFLAFLMFSSSVLFATTHKILVWSGYFNFVNEATGNNILVTPLTIQLGDTIQFLPLDPPTMMHTITSTNIPSGATAFDQMWQLPADTFFQYVPAVSGVYNFECTPHVSMGMVGAFTVLPGSLGVSGYYSDASFTCYPNPAIDNLYLRFNENIVGKTYSIADLQGRMVKAGILYAPITAVNLNSLPSGVYILSLDDKSKQPLRIVKN